jgi:CRISPR/Cas system-associated exonuclease Cas4 (RecB family)
MSNFVKRLSIFIASPSDIVIEREKFEEIVASLKPTADYFGVVLEVKSWRDVVPDMGRPQEIIFKQLDLNSFDLFVGILWHRFGTPSGGIDKETEKVYISGTEEEYLSAFKLWKEYGKPRIIMYRSTRKVSPIEIDPEQLKNVNNFFEEFKAIKDGDTKGGHPGLYQTFETTEQFQWLWLKNLQSFLIEYQKNKT